MTTPPDWYEQVAELYRQVSTEIDPHQDLCQLRGICCDFREADHRLYATEVEVRFALRFREIHGKPALEAEGPGLCPFWQGGLCHAREERPLGCRTYFCDPSWKDQGEEIHSRHHRRLAQIGEEAGIPYLYQLWVDRVPGRP